MAKAKKDLTQGMPNFEDMSSEELERQQLILKIKKDWLAVAKEEFVRMERENELCTISTALASFAGFLQPVRDFLSGLPDFIQDIVPSLTPNEYKAIQDMVSEQTERLAQNQVHLTISSTRQEAHAASDIARNKKRRANLIKGRLRDAK